MAGNASITSYWQKALANAHPLLELPLDKTRPNKRAYSEFSFVEFSLKQQDAARLHQLQLPVPVLCLAAYEAFLARVSRQDTITLGCNPHSLLLNDPAAAAAAAESHNGPADTHADLYADSSSSNNHLGSSSSLPEPSCNSITEAQAVDTKGLSPLCLTVDTETESLLSLAARVAAGLAEMAPHTHTPLKDICDAVKARPSDSYHPIFQAGFLLTPSHFSRDDLTAAAAAAMHPMAASAGALSASLIRSALFQRGSSTSFSLTAKDHAGGCPAPLDLLLALHGPARGCAGMGGARRAGQQQVQDPAACGGVRGVLGYSKDVFEPQMMALLVEHFEVFLSAAAANPHSALATLPMMSPAEQQQVLHAFNDTGLPPAHPSQGPQGLLVHHQFMARAAERPGAPCLIYDGEVLTYGQVDAASNTLAHHLIRSRGVREGDVTGLLMQRCPNMLVGMLGILKAGAAYLPLDAGHPPSRTAFIVGDAGLKVIVTQPDLASLLPPACDSLAHVVLPTAGPLSAEALLGGTAAAAAASTDGSSDSSDSSSPGLLGRPEDLVYVIYTSGSTGNPKGVMVQHSNLVNFLAWEAAAFGHSPSADVFLQKTPTNFDVSVEELWTPLVTGAPLVIAKPNGHKDTGYLLQLIEAHGVTNLSMVPSQITMLLLELEGSPNPLPSLKRILSAGEALTSSLARQVAQVLPHVELVNAYGPTEATVYITHHTYDPAAPPNGRPTVSIGKPLTNSKCYILDRKNRLCPLGVPGELVVSGPQITRGYLNLPDKTAAVFVPNPYASSTTASGSSSSSSSSSSSGPDAVMYHTGDLARWLPDGRIECMGRTDHQVKLRGYRIELQEIESALVEQPGIAAAMCCVLKDMAGQDRLVAYAESAAAVDRLALHASLARRLPGYMVPEYLVVLAALPRLSNEKLNRKALPQPDWTSDALGPAAAAGGSSGSSGSSSGPRYTARQLAGDPVLDAVAAAWGKALGVDPLTLGPKSDFMGLGGNSLQAGLMAAAVRRALVLPRLSGLLIYSHSTLGKFVQEVQAQAKASAAAAAAAAAATAATTAGEGSKDTRGVADAASKGSGCGVTLIDCRADASSDGSTSSGVTSGSRGWLLPLWVVSTLQLLAAAVCSGVHLVFALAPLLTVQLAMAHMNEWTVLAFIPVAKVLTIISAVLLHVTAKWLLVGRYKPGVHPIYGLHYLAWWIERMLFKNVKAVLLPFTRGTALHNAYLRLLGARIAPDALCDAEDVSEYDLVEIEAGAFVGGNTVISPGSKQALSNKQGIEAAHYPYGTFTHSPIVVGRNAVVSGLCVLAGPSASVPEDAVLPPNSSSSDPDALRRGQMIGAEGLRLANKPLGVLPALASLVVLVLFESLMLVPATVGVMLLWDHLSSHTTSVGDTASSMMACWAVPETRRTHHQVAECNELLIGEIVSVAAFGPMLMASNLLLLFLFVVPLKWLWLGKMTGAKLSSRNALRQWSIHTFVVLQRSPHVRMATVMIQGTEAFNVFLRMIGYKVGRQAWVGNHNISLVTPDMLTIGSTVSMGSDSHFYNATPTATGHITFADGVDVGHQTTLFPGAVLQPGAVLGAKSNVMEGEVLPAGAIRLGTALLKGGKDIESCGTTTTTSTTNTNNGALLESRLVSPLRYATCNAITLLGNFLIIPFSYMLISLPLFTLVMVAVYEGSGVLVGPAVLMGFALNFTLNLCWQALLRRLLVPRTAGVHPFYSSFFVRWNLWTGAFWVATQAFSPFFGSQLIIWFYRALGTPIGRHCCIGGGYSAEPDCFSIGDGCVLEAYSAASNHTIERRKLTVGSVKLADRVTLGVYGVMFPDSEAESGAVLGNCSVLLKGERAMAGTKWVGIPAEPVW